MSHQITLTVSNQTFSRMARKARDIGRGTKPEDVAADWIEEGAKADLDLAKRFRDAARVVDRRLAANSAIADDDRYDYDHAR